MAEPIGALRVELEASTAAFTADLQKAKAAAQRFSEGTGNAFRDTAQSIEVTSRSMRAITTSARFVSSTLGSELHPAVSATANEFLSLGSVAAAMGGTMATIAGTAGVGALVVALGFLVKEAIDAANKVKALFDALNSGDIAVMETSLHETNKLINILEGELLVGITLWRRFWLAGTGELAEDILKQEIARLKELRNELGAGIITTKEMIQADKDRLSLMEQLGNEAKEAAGKELQAREKLVESAKNLREQMALVASETRAAAGQELAGIRKDSEESAIARSESNLAISERRFKVMADTRTEAEKFLAKLQELNELQLDQETHTRAVEQLEQAWQKAEGGVREYKETMTDAQKLSISLMDLFALQVSSSMADVIFEANSAREAFADFTKEIGKAVLQMTALAGIKAGLKAIGGRFLSFQHGGVVPGPIGQPQLAVVHGGEMVTPAGEMGGGTINISVDARGAQKGVGPEVQRAIIAGMQQVRSEIVPVVDADIRRGGRLNTSIRR